MKTRLLLSLWAFLSIFSTSCLLKATTLYEDEDAQFRVQVVGDTQVKIEKALIEAQNGVVVLFTPTHSTPLMISEKGELPDGLIPLDRMKNYELTVKPRVQTTHDLPKAGVKLILVRHEAHRPHTSEPSITVDEAYYQSFIKAFPNQIKIYLIKEDLFKQFDNAGMPAAFYYFIPKDQKQPQFMAIFGKQINATLGNQLKDPGAYQNRPADLEIVNNLLSQLGMPSLIKVHGVTDMDR